MSEAGEPIDPRRPRAAQSDDDSSSAPLGLIIGLTSAAVACVAAVALVVVYQRRNTNGAHTPAVVEMDAVTNHHFSVRLCAMAVSLALPNVCLLCPAGDK